MSTAAFDVCQEFLDVSHAGRFKRIRNAIPDIDQYLSEAKPQRVAMESTGTLHLLLAKRALAHKVQVFVVNPRRFYAYKKSENVRGKTDRIDAQVLENYIDEKHERLKPFELPSSEIQQLKELVVRRRALVESQIQVMASLREARCLAEVKKMMAAAFKSALKEIDLLLASLLQKIEGSERLLEVPGFGPVVTAGLLSLLERYPFATADAFVAYLGLDPRADDSGKRKGKRYISCEGDSSVRKLLYAAALSACRTKAWKPYYQKQREKNLSTTESLLILARKMARTAWSIHKTKRPFDLERISTKGVDKAP